MVSKADPFLWKGSSFAPRAALPRQPTGIVLKRHYEIVVYHNNSLALVLILI
jgi:hypothetical protein